MKESFRTWKELEQPIEDRLNKYPSNLDRTTKWNMLLRDLLGLKRMPLPIVRKDPPPDAPRICIRGFRLLEDKAAQVVKCGTCKVADFDRWRACQEQNLEERRKVVV